MQARRDVIEQQLKDKKYDEITEDERTEQDKCRTDIEVQEQRKREVFAAYEKENPVVPQLIDLALLQNGLLKGEALANFLKCSVDLIK